MCGAGPNTHTQRTPTAPPPPPTPVKDRATSGDALPLGGRGTPSTPVAPLYMPVYMVHTYIGGAGVVMYATGGPGR